MSDIWHDRSSLGQVVKSGDGHHVACPRRSTGGTVVKAYLALFPVAWCICVTDPASAAARDMYRDKRYPFLELRLHQDAAAATACILGRIYAARLQKQNAETREQVKSGSVRLTMIGWGKDVSLSLDVDSSSASDTRIRIHGWQPQFPTLSGTFVHYETCLAQSPSSTDVTAYAVDQDRSLVGRVVKTATTPAFSAVSTFPAASLVDCIAAYPSKTSYKYNGYYYSPQVIAYPDRSIRIGWYDSGNMVTPPGPIYDSMLSRLTVGAARWR